MTFDLQKMATHTLLQKLTVPRGAPKSLLSDLGELHRVFDRVDPQGRLGGVTVGELQARLLLGAGVEPEYQEVFGNLLMYGGASCQWQTLIGNGTATADQALTFFSNARAAIGVGDSTTVAAATHTDLQAASNKLRVAMNATYPLHTDGVTSGAASIAFASTFSTAQANWAWQEWGIFNSVTAATGRMLQRKVESLGTKTSASAWTLTLTLSLA